MSPRAASAPEKRPGKAAVTAPASPRRPQKSRTFGPLAGVLTGVFLLKFLVVWQLHDHPLVQPDVGLDTTAYVELAKKVLAGNVGLGPGVYYVSPLYIYVLAAAYGLTKSFTAVRLFQILLGTASVGFIFLSAREWFGERAAWIATGLAAFTGLFTFYEALILQASIDPFMTSAALLAVTYALKRGGPWWLIAGLHLRRRDVEPTEHAARRRGHRRRAAAHAPRPARARARRGPHHRHVARGDSQRRRLTRVVVRLLARRAELLHRQQRDRDRILPSAARHHAEHRRTGARRQARGPASARTAAQRVRSVRLLLRAGVDVDSAAPGRRADPVSAQARLRLQRAAHRAAVQLSVLRLRRAHDAAVLRDRAVDPRAAGPGGARDRDAAHDAHGLLRVARVRAELCDFRRGVFHRGAVSRAAPDPAVHWRGRGRGRRVARGREEAAQHAARPRRRVPRDLRPRQLAARTARRPVGRGPPHGRAARRHRPVRRGGTVGPEARARGAAAGHRGLHRGRRVSLEERDGQGAGAPHEGRSRSIRAGRTSSTRSARRCCATTSRSRRCPTCGVDSTAAPTSRCPDTTSRSRSKRPGIWRPRRT